MTIFAFFLTALLGGGNSVAVRFSNVELAPFWGATIRLGASALIFWLILYLWRIPIPQKRDALILLLTGFFAVGVSFGLLYFGFVKLQASLGSVIIALGPLMTFFLAVLHRIETFRWQSLLGGIIALVGIAIAARAQLGTNIPILSVLALIVGSAISAEGNVILKILSPKSDPMATNALMLSSGSVFLSLTSLLIGETHNVPTLPATWMAIAYTVVPGSVIMFYLFVWILSRWSASATSYVIMLFPIVATIAGALLAGEKITLTFILGGTLVLIGVWIGALMKR
ncbi:MAG: DMT family transporter [Anaerolineae bacterium]|nr:DMT family transporter [Anaerolineae bacterium]